MFTLLILLSQLPIVTLAFPPYTSNGKDARHAPEEVFASKEEANFFIHRHLLYNRFDLELFLPSDLERECQEEFCNYEEAREIFLDEDKTMEFWKEYSIKGPTTKSDGSGEKIDVIRILIGIIAGGTLLVTCGLCLYYVCITKRKRQPHAGCSVAYVRNGSFSINLRRPEEAILSPSVPSLEDTGLPSYEQAMELNRKHNVSPPPPYPGLAKGFRVFKKSMSLPSH
ncbi:PREDICTED: transmembrane gamma-carboxyglutamic acid protein 4 [Chinchilla lanigera]|uniref:transmembrane gamma-carboxyglutamic acid protein 4 n=1 Tax=Chinchilla lanigera TaxID=34839 RepID=UPI0006976618|nr:PREDICTED: transmembrane gamma-carboxyglutamic acid protein 4 [Chinchilla lanigera]